MTRDQVADAIERFEERAAIREFDAGLSRANAESAALREVSEACGKDLAREVQKYRTWKASKERV